MKLTTTVIVILIITLACNKASTPQKSSRPAPIELPAAVNQRPASLGLIGDAADVKTNVNGGVVLMGGSTDVSAAFKWMIERSGGGDVVIIRASGTNAYNP
jgi:cyanophycinase